MATSQSLLEVSLGSNPLALRDFIVDSFHDDTEFKELYLGNFWVRRILAVQVLFLAHILQRLRKEFAAFKAKQLSKSGERLKQKFSEDHDPLRIGIIGGGDTARAILDMCIRSGQIAPNQLFVSTRRTDILGRYGHTGINLSFDNQKLVSSCHLICLACLPNQVSEIASEVRGLFPPTTLLCSTLVGVPTPKLLQMFPGPCSIPAVFDGSAWSKASMQADFTLSFKSLEAFLPVQELHNYARAACTMIVSHLDHLKLLLQTFQSLAVSFGFPAADAPRYSVLCVLGSTSLIPTATMTTSDRYRSSFGVRGDHSSSTAALSPSPGPNSDASTEAPLKPSTSPARSVSPVRSSASSLPAQSTISSVIQRFKENPALMDSTFRDNFMRVLGVSDNL